jgi:hypothetical protein
VSTLAEGGYIRIGDPAESSKQTLKEEDVPLEYLLAHFGTKVSYFDAIM